MAERMPCDYCGALNATGADFCGQCFHPVLPLAAGETRPVAAGATLHAAPPPPPPAPPPEFPRHGTAASEVPPPPAIDIHSALSGSTPRPEEFFIPKPKLNPIRWRWGHLWVFGLFAWGVPRLLGETVSADSTWSEMLSATLAFQILGYILAVIVAVVFVHKAQGGDWSTLGLTRSENTPMEITLGLGYGLLLLGVWSAIGWALSGGEMEMDRLVTSLIGDTSQIGLLMAAIVVVIGAPIIEEIYYRGMLYEKLARRSRVTAVVVTSILFVAAHGAIIIPALLVLAFGLAIARGSRPLWFTIGAHAGWNFAIIIMAAYMVFSPAELFSPDDGAYSLRFPSGWQRSEEFETMGVVPGMSADLVLTTGSGGLMTVGRVEMPPGTSPKAVKQNMNVFRFFAPGGMSVKEPRESDIVIEGHPTVFEIQMETPTIEGIQGEAHLVMAFPNAGRRAYFFVLVCPKASCGDNAVDFKGMLRSLNVSAGA
jgi:uncharacterized protein